MNLEIQSRLRETMERYGFSQSRAANEIGYTAPVISSYLANKYTGDVEKLEDAVIRWIARQEQARARKRVPLVETDHLVQITNAIALAHSEADIALIVDDAGTGKSTAARYYAEQNPRTTILVDVVRGMTARSLTQELARCLGIDSYRVPQQALVQNIASALADRAMVVILDEADYLKNDALEFSRRLVNDLGHSGLVLMGLPRLTGTIQNLKNDHRQLESRIGVYLPLVGLTKKDARKIAETVWPALDAEALDAMYRISRTDVRQFVKVIERSQSTMALNKLDKVSVEVIESAARMVIRRNWR